MLLFIPQIIFQTQVLITNEITSRISDDNKTELVPALGDTHPHRTNYQISLARDLNDPQLFYARIDKHLSEGTAQIPLRVGYHLYDHILIHDTWT